MLKPYSSDHSSVNTDACKPLIYFIPLNFPLLTNPPPRPPSISTFSNMSDPTLKRQASLWSVHGTLLMLPYINNFGLQTPFHSYFLLLTRFLSSGYGTVWITHSVFLRAASYMAFCICYIKPVTFSWLGSWSLSPAFCLRNDAIINIAMHVPSGIPVNASLVFLGQRACPQNSVIVARTTPQPVMPENPSTHPTDTWYHPPFQCCHSAGCPVASYCCFVFLWSLVCLNLFRHLLAIWASSPYKKCLFLSFPIFLLGCMPFSCWLAKDLPVF